MRPSAFALALGLALSVGAGASVAHAADTGDSGDTSEGSTETGDDTGTDAGNDTATTVDDGTYGGQGVAELAGETGGWGCEGGAAGVLVFGLFGLGLRRRD